MADISAPKANVRMVTLFAAVKSAATSFFEVAVHGLVGQHAFQRGRV